MVDNYLPVFEMNKQIKTLKKKKINEKLNIIVDNINNKKKSILYSVLFERIFTKIVKLMFLNIVDGRINNFKKYRKHDKKNLINTDCGKPV